MKKLALAATVAMAAGFAVHSPAQAVSEYKIKTTRTSNVTDGGFVFGKAGCNPALDGSAIDGVDTVIIDISSRQNQFVTINWSGDARPAQTALGIGLIPRFFSGSCGEFFNAASSSGVFPGNWTIFVPNGAKWLTITSNGILDATVRF